AGGFRRGARGGAQARGARPEPRRDVREAGAAPLRGVHPGGQALGGGSGTAHRGCRPVALPEAARARGPAPFRLRRGFRGSRRKKEGGRVSLRRATRVLLPLAMLAGFVLGLSAARAAGGELKPWSGGATPPLALRDLQGRSEEHTSELQSRVELVCRLLLQKKKHAQCT